MEIINCSYSMFLFCCSISQKVMFGYLFVIISCNYLLLFQSIYIAYISSFRLRVFTYLEQFVLSQPMSMGLAFIYGYLILLIISNILNLIGLIKHVLLIYNLIFIVMQEDIKKQLRKTCQYDILGLPKNSNIDDIKKAYRKKALEFHPDKNKNNGAKEVFNKVSAAYATLSKEAINTNKNNSQKSQKAEANYFKQSNFFNNRKSYEQMKEQFSFYNKYWQQFQAQAQYQRRQKRQQKRKFQAQREKARQRQKQIEEMLKKTEAAWNVKKEKIRKQKQAQRAFNWKRSQQQFQNIRAAKQQSKKKERQQKYREIFKIIIVVSVVVMVSLYFAVHSQTKVMSQQSKSSINSKSSLYSFVKSVQFPYELKSAQLGFQYFVGKDFFNRQDSHKIKENLDFTIDYESIKNLSQQCSLKRDQLDLLKIQLRKHKYGSNSRASMKKQLSQITLKQCQMLKFLRQGHNDYITKLYS